MASRLSPSRICAAFLLALLVVPTHSCAQERRPREASAIGTAVGGIAGLVVGLRLGEVIGEPAGCCGHTVAALAVEATSVALGATAGNLGRGSFLADVAVSGAAVAVFARAASDERFDVAVLALLGQLVGVVATEVATSPRVPMGLTVLPIGSGVEVALAVRPAR